MSNENLILKNMKGSFKKEKGKFQSYFQEEKESSLGNK